MVKKVKNAYKKTDGSPNDQARALLQLHDTPITADLPSPSRDPPWTSSTRYSSFKTIQEGQYMSICQRLVELQEKQKEQFDRAHQARDLCPLKVKEQVQFFQNKPASGPIKWTTGTMTEIIRMWMILHNPRLQRQSLQKESSSFKAHLS